MTGLTAVATSTAILAGVAGFFGVLIAVANSRFRVEEDPRLDQLSDLLPGANCGACGFAGCRAFAEAALGGKVAPAGCTVISAAEQEDIAQLLGVGVGDANRRVARLLCAGGDDVAFRKADYVGIRSCAAAVAVSGGGKACPWGCLGFADCAVSCDFDAITMTPWGLPVVDPELCTACNDCVEACPLDLFVLLPLDAPLLVQCRNLLEGETAEAMCSVVCNGCRRCVQDAKEGLITMDRGLAVVNYDQIEWANPKAVERCPTGAIVWVEGAQSFSLRVPAASEVA